LCRHKEGGENKGQGLAPGGGAKFPDGLGSAIGHTTFKKKKEERWKAGGEKQWTIQKKKYTEKLHLPFNARVTDQRTSREAARVE